MPLLLCADRYPRASRGRDVADFRWGWVLFLAYGLWSLGVYAGRRAALGTFLVDPGARSFRRGQQTWTFEEIEGVVLSRDWLDASQMNTLPPHPHWLMAVTRGGDELCLARGRARDLAPVLDALRSAGLPMKV